MKGTPSQPGLPASAEIEQELGEKEKLLPNTEDGQRWSDAAAIVAGHRACVQCTKPKRADFARHDAAGSWRTGDLIRLFGQKTPVFDPERWPNATRC